MKIMFMIILCTCANAFAATFTCIGEEPHWWGDGFFKTEIRFHLKDLKIEDRKYKYQSGHVVVIFSDKESPKAPYKESRRFTWDHAEAVYSKSRSGEFLSLYAEDLSLRAFEEDFKLTNGKVNFHFTRPIVRIQTVCRFKQ